MQDLLYPVSRLYFENLSADDGMRTDFLYFMQRELEKHLRGVIKINRDNNDFSPAQNKPLLAKLFVFRDVGTHCQINHIGRKVLSVREECGDMVRYVLCQ
jgi:hypothetical protein